MMQDGIREVDRPKYLLTTTELGRLIGQTAQEVAESFDGQALVTAPGGKVCIPPSLVKETLAARGVDYSFRVWAHVNMRGGIGKTISTITAATRAAQYGFKTCILDLDPQASASLAFDCIPADDEPIFYDVWQRPAEMLLGALKQIQDSLYILPSLLDNALLDISLQQPKSQRFAVAGVCEELQKAGFDLVIIDCPPSLGGAVISTICAAHIIVVPIASDAFSFRGLDMTLDEIAAICETFRLPKPDVAALLTRYVGRQRLSQAAQAKLEENYADYLLPVTIRSSTAFSKALERNQTVFANARRCTAREDYDRYVKHVLDMDFSEKGV